MSGRDAATGTSVSLKSDFSSLAPGSARSLLLTVLGEFVWPNGKPVWTSSLLHVLKGLGIEEQTARQAIARAASSGWIEGERHGREVRWSLTERGKRIFEEGSPRVRSMSDPFSNWNGTWLTLLVTIPHTHRTTRKKLYSGLTWAGFGNPASGVWVSPHPERSAEVAGLIDQLELREHTISFVGRVGDVGIPEERIVEEGWDLAALEEHYKKVLDAITGLRPAPGDEMLFTHVRMVSEWQRFPLRDPQLPEALLPDWIGRRAARHIEALRAQWWDQVQAHWAKINSGGGKN
ncbi:PaaX family transcriptional regulator [Actinomadura sp. NBRC 104425]|uniref:PaaX family transcriptional regulator n=1 Tax=Actinomadura sp. NBRC 104425 TaxID=3032204 RepID=UPI0024A3DED5|nr:PaaX family transcriptional regulator C-terminal domain-containing protein [Actinomadura sp. NBRC 104425]GLZ15774.1 PaaX family transcriptional regulator [Actinomadura sp. NBRC 104425]